MNERYVLFNEPRSVIALARLVCAWLCEDDTVTVKTAWDTADAFLRHRAEERGRISARRQDGDAGDR
jgi:hypothetical protein